MTQTLELLHAYINFDALLPEMNDQIRARYPHPATDEQIACEGFCTLSTVVWTEALQQRLQTIGEFGLQAYSVAHESDSVYHCYTVVDRPEEPGVIVDATYKQFISTAKRPAYPSLYVGTASGMIEILKSNGQYAYQRDLYRRFTRTSKTPEDYRALEEMMDE